MNDLLIPLLVLCAILTSVFLVLAVSNPKRFSEDTSEPVQDDDYVSY